MADVFRPWDAAEYALNIPEMDEEHRRLIERMNNLWALREQSASFPVCNRAFHELVGSARKHFASEEAYMERIGFPGLRVHSGIHRQLLERLTELEQQFRSERVLNDEVLTFFRTWIGSHIRGIDTQYAAHALSLPAALPR